MGTPHCIHPNSPTLSPSQLLNTWTSRSWSHFKTDGRSVSQYVLVSSTLVGLATRYYFLSECYCLNFLSVSQFVLVSSTLVGLATKYYFLSECCYLNFLSQSVCLGIEHPCGTCDQILFPVGMLLSEFSVNQSVSMSWYRTPLWDLRPDITCCRNVAVWNLLSCFCGQPSLTRGRVCNLQRNHSMVRVAQNPKPYFTVSSETLPTKYDLFLQGTSNHCVGCSWPFEFS
jgi:hypothetical protein